MAFSTAIGLVKWAEDIQAQAGANMLSSMLGKMGSVGGVGHMVKGWLKELMP